MQSFDVAIVGAGLVGASLACALAQRQPQLRIALIEAGNDLHTYSGEKFDPRVVALTQASQELLIDIGVWDSILAERACPYSDMQVWDGEGTAEIHFNCAEVRADQLGYIVENSVALKALREKISQHGNIHVIQPARINSILNNHVVTAVLDTDDSITATLLIAADGAHSTVRELAAFETREWDYGQKAIITAVQTEQPHQSTAWQRFMRTGPLAFLPLPDVNGKHFCSIVWSAEHALADELILLTDEEFCARVGTAFEHKLGRVFHASERFAIPLRQRHAKDYIKPNIALVGDAAHNIHPLAGQGVNLGLLDVIALAQEIARACERQLPLSDFSILRRYQRQRLAGNLGMMTAMEAFKRLFGSDSLMLAWLRNSGMRQLNSLTAVKKVIVKAAMGLD